MKIYSRKQFIQFLTFTLGLIFILPGFASAVIPEVDDVVVMTFTTADGGKNIQEIYGMDHEIISPLDPASGLPTGKRQHKPVSVSKPIDNSSPIFTKMLLNGEKFTEMRITTIRTKNSQRHIIHSALLVNAGVCGVGNSLTTPKTGGVETISLCYQKIIWTWQDGTISAEDSWE